MIESIELKNFKKHENLKLEVPEGVTSIQGDNAKGKSSVLKGILFGLLGAAAAGAKDHLWRWGADGEKSVALEMTLPDHGRVRIIRTHKDAQVMAMDGRILASGNSPVTKFIEESLGMLAKDLRTLIYSPQGESQGILTMGPTALQGKVESLARMNVVDDVLGRIGTDVSYMNGKLEAIQIADLDFLLKQKAELETAILYHHNEYQGLESSLHSLNEKSSALQESIQNANVVNAAIQRYRKDLHTATEELSKMEFNLAEIDKELASIAISPDETCEEIERRTEESSQKLSSYLERLSRQKSKDRKLAELMLEIPELEAVYKQHKEADELLGKLRPKMDQTKADLAEKKRIATDLQVTISSLQRSLKDAICPLCKREMEGINQEAIQQALNTNNEALTPVLAEINGLTAIINELLADERNLSHRLNPLVESRLAVAKDQLKTFQEMDDDTEVTDTVVSALRDSVDQGKKWIREERSRRDRHAKLSGQRKSYFEMIEGKKAYVVKLQEEASEELIDTSAELLELQTLSASIVEVTKAVNTCKQTIFMAESKLAGITREIEAGQTLQAERASLEEKKANTEELQKFLRKNRSTFSEDIWGGLLNYASSLIHNTTDGRLSELTRADSGDFSIKEDGRVVPIAESSGAQRSIVGLALRIALSKIFYGDNLLLLLDEATSDASDETAAAISGMLNSLNFKIISVSHRQGDTVNAGNIVEL